MSRTSDPAKYLSQIVLPSADSHKGQNGKLLIIGGSELFHAASKWSLDVAAHIVDMVFYSSVPSNNELVLEAKREFWSGIVVPRSELLSYVEEADCILIGPGMEREAFVKKSPPQWRATELHGEQWQDTALVVNALLAQHPEKKWVIDAGALQMVEPALLNSQCIITPHPKELERVLEHIEDGSERTPQDLSAQTGSVIVLKAATDRVYAADGRTVEILGGSPGMTKGGTGDVLAGLIAALYCRSDALPAAVVGALVNKRAAEYLHGAVGPFFSTSELAEQVPKTLWQLRTDEATIPA